VDLQPKHRPPSAHKFFTGVSAINIHGTGSKAGGRNGVEAIGVWLVIVPVVVSGTFLLSVLPHGADELGFMSDVTVINSSRYQLVEQCEPACLDISGQVLVKAVSDRRRSIQYML